jgi:hypothetical protein
VLFSSKCGKCIGHWCDGKATLKSYFVEIDIPDILTANQVKQSTLTECSFNEDNGDIKIVGLLEDYEVDGFATIRMNDSLICFETIFNTKIKEMINKYIEIKVGKIHLFDQNVI